MDVPDSKGGAQAGRDPDSGAEGYVEFDPPSLRTAFKTYANVFQLSNGPDDVTLTFGHTGDALPAEAGALDGKNFADAVVFLTPSTALDLLSSLSRLVDEAFGPEEEVPDRTHDEDVLEDDEL